MPRGVKRKLEDSSFGLPPKVAEGGTDGTKAESGNTRDSALLYFFFTFNGYKEEDLVPLFNIMEHECDWYLVQEEMGEEQLKKPINERAPHLQGTLKLKKRQRKEALFAWNGRMNVQITHKVDATINYCSKDRTRWGRRWVKGLTLNKEELMYHEPRGWQKDLENILLKKPDERTVYWYWEPTGNVGKTTFTRYCSIKHDALIVSGKQNDIFHIVAKRVQAGKPPRIIIVDIPRTNADYVPYGAIESVKNGIFCSGKYDGDMIIYNWPHVVVFANQEPDYDQMSADRWNVVRIEPTQ